MRLLCSAERQRPAKSSNLHGFVSILAIPPIRPRPIMNPLEKEGRMELLQNHS